jgi:alkyl sulfatase BDS1-like metallo-beta-lactamase superfamily hydrolase
MGERSTRPKAGRGDSYGSATGGARDEGRPLSLLGLLACSTAIEPAPAPPPSLTEHCEQAIGPPRVIELGESAWMALGYDLASTTLIRTSEGLVVIDPAQSPARAELIREAFGERAEGPVHTLIFTHSHIDHVGGASVWVEEGTQVIATEAFSEHFFKQYGRYLAAERDRAARQFGHLVPPEALPCHALGARMDLDAAMRSGAVMPTRSFSDSLELEIGETRIRLLEAHGETHDQLLVWLPEQRLLLPGDNWYRAFPNLYTVRGSSPRDVDAWVDSLDTMRSLEPEILAPSHTAPVFGASEIQHELTVYRDAIQFLRDEVARAAMEGEDLDRLVARIRLPEELAREPSLSELYGQVEWSTRAIYTNDLGWFDGRPGHLYPLPPDQIARRSLELMGGREATLAQAEAAIDTEPRWALHLLELLEEDGLDVSEPQALAYEALAASVPNSNGRAYLLQAAAEARGARSDLGEPQLSEDFVQGIPLELIFEVLASRLDPSRAEGVHESVRFELGEETWTLTVRRGVCEVWLGDPLPGTPEPVARVIADSDLWRRIALQQRSAPEAVLSGELEVDEPTALLTFLARFDRE